ncbi:MAG: energy transducer TonB [Gemmatimonadales bacterium]
MMTRVVTWTMIMTAGLVSVGCNKGEQADQPFSGVGARPDVLPVMLNKDLPFRYPPALYAKKVQANVTLRVFIDKEGLVVNESTHVAESSGIPSLDSAAVKGSGELRFIPAKTRGEAVPVSILFPVYFRHPEAPPLPGDTILKKNGTAAMPNAPPSVKDTSKPTAPATAPAGKKKR